MLWRLDFFFTLKPSVSSDQIYDSEKKDQTEDTNKEEETFKPEGDAEKESKNEENQEDGSESDDSNPEVEFDDKDEEFFKVLKITDDTPRDFTHIKAVYRKKIAQYHPDKVSAMGPEIQEVAEQKAKEINEAYEHFSKKFSRN